jgi:hypothetical protein
LQNTPVAERKGPQVVPGKPSVVKRGDDHHPAVLSVRLPVFQVVLSEDGFKLHLVINDMGEICSFCLTVGNIDVIGRLCRELYGKLFGDWGYICQELFERLYEQDIRLIRRLRKNMKNKLMEMQDKILLRKRAVIESVNDFLKNICQVEHRWQRSIVNFLVNILAGISAYSFLSHKPSIHGFSDERALPTLA